MFTASKWRKRKEEAQIGADLLLWLTYNQNYFSRRRLTATYLFSKEDFQAVNKAGDDSPCR